jgi:hypothetical protein
MLPREAGAIIHPLPSPDVPRLYFPSLGPSTCTFPIYHQLAPSQLIVHAPLIPSAPPPSLDLRFTELCLLDWYQQEKHTRHRPRHTRQGLVSPTFHHHVAVMSAGNQDAKLFARVSSHRIYKCLSTTLTQSTGQGR